MLWLAVVPLAASVAGTAIVDILWTGRAGASSAAHATFESVAPEQVRGRWGFSDRIREWETWHS